MTINVKCVLCGEIFRTETNDTRLLVEHLQKAHPELKLGPTPDSPSQLVTIEQQTVQEEDFSIKNKDAPGQHDATRTETTKKPRPSKEDKKCKCGNEFKKHQRVSGLYLQSNRCKKEEKPEPPPKEEECKNEEEYRASILSRSFFLDNCCLNKSGRNSFVKKTENFDCELNDFTLAACGENAVDLKHSKNNVGDAISERRDVLADEDHVIGESADPVSCRINTGTSTQTATGKLREMCTQTDTSKKNLGSQCRLNFAAMNKSKNVQPSPKVEPDSAKEYSIKISKNGEYHEFESKYFPLIEKLLELEKLKVNIAFDLTEIDSEISREQAPQIENKEVGQQVEKNKKHQESMHTEKPKSEKSDDGTEDDKSEKLHNVSMDLERAKKRLKEISEELKNINNIDKLYAGIGQDVPRKKSKSAESDPVAPDSKHGNPTKLQKEMLLQEKLERLESRLEIAHKHLTDIADGLTPIKKEDHNPDKREGNLSKNLPHADRKKSGYEPEAYNEKHTDSRTKDPVDYASLKNIRLKKLEHLERKLNDLKQLAYEE